jgi:signal peptidase II
VSEVTVCSRLSASQGPLTGRTGIDCDSLDGERATARTGASKSRSILKRGGLVGGAVVLIDQLTKAGAIALGNTAVTHPQMNAEFSLGLAGGSLSVMVLVTIAGIAAFGAYVVWASVHGRLPAWVAGFLIGGAMSNLADRLLFGAVRDFVATPWVLWNLADLAVLMGIAAYAWRHLRPSQSTFHHPEEVIPT